MTITNEQAIGYMKMAIDEMKLSVSESRSDKKLFLR